MVQACLRLRYDILVNKYELAQNIDADPAELTELASDKDSVIRCAVASNPSMDCACTILTPHKALELLLLDLEVHDEMITTLLKRNKKSGQA